MKKVIFIVISLLMGCASPPTKLARLEKKAEPCLKGKAILATALVCLEKKGYDDWYTTKNSHSYSSCGMYWGFPFIASCSYITINHDGVKIKSYKLTAELDAV